MDTDELKVIDRYHKMALASVYKYMLINKLPPLEWDEFHIIDSYLVGYNEYNCLVWQDSTVFEFFYSLKEKELLSTRNFIGYDDYPKNASIHSSLIRYYNENRVCLKEGLKDVPVTGRSNNGSYLYTNVKHKSNDQIELISYALRQW